MRLEWLLHREDVFLFLDFNCKLLGGPEIDRRCSKELI
jgi:hypothetical protein